MSRTSELAQEPKGSLVAYIERTEKLVAELTKTRDHCVDNLGPTDRFAIACQDALEAAIIELGQYREALRRVERGG